MKKIRIIFMLVICISLCFTSCGLFETPAKAKRVGCGEVQYDRGNYFVEIDSFKYVLSYVYVSISDQVEHDAMISNAVKDKLNPVVGMKVTGFMLHGNNEVKFIVGDWDEEHLEDAFTTNSALYFIMIILTLGGAMLIAYNGVIMKNKKS